MKIRIIHEHLCRDYEDLFTVFATEAEAKEAVAHLKEYYDKQWHLDADTEFDVCDEWGFSIPDRVMVDCVPTTIYTIDDFIQKLQ